MLLSTKCTKHTKEMQVRIGLRFCFAKILPRKRLAQEASLVGCIPFVLFVLFVEEKKEELCAQVASFPSQPPKKRLAQEASFVDCIPFVLFVDEKKSCVLR